jgi:hypothetical protein
VIVETLRTRWVGRVAKTLSSLYMLRINLEGALVYSNVFIAGSVLFRRYVIHSSIRPV